jgi:homoserine kinase type II
MMPPVDERAVLAAWPLSSPITVQPTTSGLNNRTHRVETPERSYLLKLYQNTRDPARVRYEHAILLGLTAQRLSFRVPTPVAARDGSTLVCLDGHALAALFPLLPGAPPDRRDPEHLRSCAAALAELHAALRRLDVGPPPAGAATYGDLDRVHPLVPDPWELPGRLPLPSDDRRRLAGLFADLRGLIPILYATLPRQLCHNDYSPGNTVQVGGRTSAIFDFEFAAPDLRAIDVAVGWYWSVGDAWGTGDELPAARAFLAGYADASALAPAEVDAMPTLALLQRATSLVHWTGRRRAGLTTDALVAEQARRLLDLDRWLLDHAPSIAAAATPT